MLLVSNLGGRKTFALQDQGPIEMAGIPWPASLRKKKPYSAEELTRANCLSAAKAILKANNGEGELIEILPPENARRLGSVCPPSGGEISEWFDHRVVRIGERYYDCMTGPEGMTEQEYRALFKHGDVIIFKKAKDQ